MKLLFFLGHPAHYHLFKYAINNLRQHYQVKVLIVKKDVLEDLVAQEDWDYENIYPEGRRIQNLPILLSGALVLAKSEIRLYRYLKHKYRPDLMIGTEGTLTHMGKIFNIPAFTVNEDDTSVVPSNYLFYPFSDKIIVPVTVDRGMWKKKRHEYPGYHELAYLHPNQFTPDKRVIDKFNPSGEKYFLIRLALLTANHDIGQKGLDTELLKELIRFLSPRGKVFITSEAKLKEEFEPYRLQLSPREIHHALYFAELFLGDSQTMTMEAAVLGTPAFRCNSFADKCSVIMELTNRYGLVFNFFPHQTKELLLKIQEVLGIPDYKGIWDKRREKMLSEKVDVTQWMTNLIEDELAKIKFNKPK